jgi:hypothetical protein
MRPQTVRAFILTTHKFPAEDVSSPTCSQCQSSSLPCQYQEGGKRGLPAAYIAALEKRLAETETALYANLIALQELNGKQLPDRDLAGATISTRHRSKAERLEEWKRLPLQTGKQLDAWLQAQQQFDTPFTSIALDSGHERTKRIERSVPTPSVPGTGVRSIQNAHDESTLTVAAMQQLRLCSPPVIPNTSLEMLDSGRWQDNYF